MVSRQRRRDAAVRDGFVVGLMGRLVTINVSFFVYRHVLFFMVPSLYLSGCNYLPLAFQSLHSYSVYSHISVHTIFSADDTIPLTRLHIPTRILHSDPQTNLFLILSQSTRCARFQPVSISSAFSSRSLIIKGLCKMNLIPPLYLHTVQLTLHPTPLKYSGIRYIGLLLFPGQILLVVVLIGLKMPHMHPLRWRS